MEQQQRDGERPAFQTLDKLRASLSKHLAELDVSDSAFTSALKFLHEVTTAHVPREDDSATVLVSRWECSTCTSAEREGPCSLAWTFR